MIAIISLFLNIAHGSSGAPRGAPEIFTVARKVRAVRQTRGLDAGNFLRKFLFKIGMIPSLSEDVVQSLLYFKQKTSFHVKTLQESIQEPGNDPNE